MPNGNILFKTGVGNFSYNEDVRPHAVTEVENADRKIPGYTLYTSFNDFGKIQLIEDTGKNLRMNFTYGPDQERWSSKLSRNSMDIRTTVYAGEYEKITERGVTREFYYLDGNAIAIREDGTTNIYLAFTDNLGSILSVMNEKGKKVFDASYDAWGQQMVTLNDIDLHRGYTGHEMLTEFDIINMNGRLYDPVLGRFFSPDNYVQMPDNSQNFNRYSYCLNNPLKYTDPSGNLFGIDDAVIAYAVFDMAKSMMQAAFDGKNIWKAGLLSLLSSAATYGIGEVFGSTGNFKHELLRAGSHGLSNAVLTAIDGGDFFSSFASGALSSGIGSYAKGIKMNNLLMVASTTVMGGVSAWATGGDFLQGAIKGMTIGLLNHTMHDGEEGSTPLKVYVRTNKAGMYEFTVIGARKSGKGDVFSIAAGITTFANCIGNSLKRNSGNSTISSNGKFYWHAAGERGFYGNQYVNTTKLTTVGKRITKVASPIGHTLEGIDIYDSYKQDGYQIGYNTARATADVAGGLAGAAAGLKVGGFIGGCIGSIPGSIVGGAVGGIVGTVGGSWLGTGFVDMIYGR